jgi:hypothetical protein
MEQSQMLLKTRNVLYGSETKNRFRAHAAFHTCGDTFIA